jgi:hypothetical protein
VVGRLEQGKPGQEAGYRSEPDIHRNLDQRDDDRIDDDLFALSLASKGPRRG